MKMIQDAMKWQNPQQLGSTCISLVGSIFFLLLLCLLIASGCISHVSYDTNTTPTPAAISLTNKSSWESNVSSIIWVAYSPPSADPNKGIEADPDAIQKDLEVLKKAGFTGLVTYSSAGPLGKDLPILAEKAGFSGLIMGVFDPLNPGEIAAAQNASQLEIVKGYCVGNEGLDKRYDLPTLAAAIDTLKKNTGKPVTTTEELEDYSDSRILNLGDWVFPNAHPYFHNFVIPESAAGWTTAAYHDTEKQAKRFVFFKEVGLPTEGDGDRVSETGQDQYYRLLEGSDTRFVYFEAFDQPWKNNLPVEPHWGIFYANRSPKVMGERLLTNNITVTRRYVEPTGIPVQTLTKAVIANTPDPFYIYADLDAENNHFSPVGYMGDIGDIHINTAYETYPHSGKTAIQIKYEAKGKAPNSCSYSPPCKWAGVYWQEPPNNWGNNAVFKNYGYNLENYSRFTFWARAEQNTTIEFKVGGISGDYGDSLKYPQGIIATLSPQWKQYEIDLTDEDLSHIIGGFLWVSDWRTNPDGVTFYLDDMRFE
jgi:exo-beta-1,3-glucanase (GH17 family)